jgi:hypothetical protein
MAWKFPRGKTAIKCVHLRQGVRVAAAKVTHFFPYASTEDAAQDAYEWALRVVKRKQLAKNAYSIYKCYVCMHYTSRDNRVHFVGVFERPVLHLLRSKIWCGRGKTLLSRPGGKVGPRPLCVFALSRTQRARLFGDTYPNPARLLTHLLTRAAWRHWNAEKRRGGLRRAFRRLALRPSRRRRGRRRRLRRAFDAWRGGGFILL